MAGSDHGLMDATKKFIEANKRTRQRNAEFVRQMKNKPCADCGIRYPYYVMDFDHVRGEKEFGFGRVTQTNIALERIIKEIAKCDVVCANCHRERTQRKIAREEMDLVANQKSGTPA